MAFPRSLAMLAVLLASGCVAPPTVDPGETTPTTATGRTTRIPEATCPDPDREKVVGDQDARIDGFNGSGEMRLEPSEPRLVPGETLRLELTFHNPDCRVFFFREGTHDCGHPPRISIGESPVRWWGSEHGLQPEWLVVHSCPPDPGYLALGPGETLRSSYIWDGAIALRPLPGPAEEGRWENRTYYVAGGEWPVWYGFSPSSYPVGRQMNLTVETNHLNRDSPLRPGACRSLGFGGVRYNVTETRVWASTPQAALGSSVAFYLSFRLHLPEPGCYLVEGEPQVVVHGAGQGFMLGEICSPGFRSDRRFTVLVEAESAVVDALVKREWDGAGRDSCRDAAVPGHYALRAVGPFWSSAAGGAGNGTFEWV